MNSIRNGICPARFRISPPITSSAAGSRTARPGQIGIRATNSAPSATPAWRIEGMDTLDLYQRLALALAIGLLVGVERGWRERDQGEGTRTAGIRTFGLIGMLGGIWGAMTPALG